MERLTNNPNLLSCLHQLGSRCRPAPQLTPAGYLASRHPELDRFLAGGLPFGSLVEVGAPLGLGGRRPIIAFIAAATGWVLWVYNRTPDQARTLQIYPPAWQAHGVDLSRICFAESARPVTELRPALTAPLFRIVVLDAPSRLSAAELTFLAHQARLSGKLIILLRAEPLIADGRSVWARLRFNCWRHPERLGAFYLEVLRGLSPRQTVIAWDPL